jgi:hypothetical protein
MGTTLNVDTRNYGIGGQRSNSIAARQGGTPATIAVAGNTIPASGPVTVTPSMVIYSNSSGTGVSTGTGKLAGIAGTLAYDNAAQTTTFTRTTPGTAVWAPPTSVWVSDESVLNRGQITVIWSGRNSIRTVEPADIVKLIRSMVDHLKALDKRYLILEIAPEVGQEDLLPAPTTNRVRMDSLNAMLAAEFPHAFVPVASYLRGPALADSGITPTTQDTNDIANGQTPASFRSDTLHLNAAGNAAVARYVGDTITKKGWL